MLRDFVKLYSENKEAFNFNVPEAEDLIEISFTYKNQVGLISFFNKIDNENALYINNKVANYDQLGDVKTNDSLKITFKDSKIPGLYRSKEHFKTKQWNKESLPVESFFILSEDPKKYLSKSSYCYSSAYDCLKRLEKLLKDISLFGKGDNGKFEFNQSSRVCSLELDWEAIVLNNKVLKDIGKLEITLSGEAPNSDEFKKLFLNELFKGTVLKKASTVVNKWEELMADYDQAKANYLEGFSLDKLKQSSEHLFIEITDKYQSLLNRFSSQVIAFPVAYALLLRFYDFEGGGEIRNLGVALLAVLYFLLIRTVLIKTAFQGIDLLEKDISSFQKRLGSSSVPVLDEKLNSIKEIIIPSIEKKVKFVQIINMILLLMTLGVWIFLTFKVRFN